MLTNFGDFVLATYDNMDINEPEAQKADFLRVELPTNSDTEILMQQKGFFFADRTLKVAISLNKCSLDLDKNIRLPIVETADYKEEILQIAQEAFVYDRRFHVAPVCSKKIVAAVLKNYVANLDNVLVALFKDKPVGFLALKKVSEEALFVHLAAVDEKYRMTGAAMALYAFACKFAKEKGYKKLEGRISSQNMAVMNLYAAFGAAFSEPKDVFVKEVGHDA